MPIRIRLTPEEEAHLLKCAEPGEEIRNTLKRVLREAAFSPRLADRVGSVEQRLAAMEKQMSQGRLVPSAPSAADEEATTPIEEAVLGFLGGVDD